MAFIVVQIFLVFVNIYKTQEFSIVSFTVIIVQLISILLSYFVGIVSAAIFAIVYVVGYVVYIIKGESKINLISYILLFFVPLSTVYAGNMNNTRRKIMGDLVRLNKLEEMQLKIDPYTQLENEVAFKEALSKHSNLAQRYSNYHFSVFMFRLEFIDTLRSLLDVKDFNHLIESIAGVIQKSIREEDYKFSLSNNRFAIITPLTSSGDIRPAIRRILEGVGKLNINDRHGERVDLVLKAGGIDYSMENHHMFKDYKTILTELQRATEVDIYGEYSN